MSKVKCVYCGKEFDTSKEPWEKPRSNRYAHASCCVKENEEYMWDKVKMYSRQQLGELYNSTKVNNQIKRFKNKLFFSPQRVYNALTYWYEVQKASPEKSNGGIGIVESVWQEAEQYYKNKQYRLNQVAKYNIKDYIKKTDSKIIVEWEPPTRPKNYHIIDLR